MNRSANDIIEKAAEFDRERLGCEPEDAEESDLLSLDPAADPFDKQRPQVSTLQIPQLGLVIAVSRGDQLEINSLPSRRMPIRRHRAEDRLGRHQRLVALARRTEPEHMRRKFLRDGRVRLFYAQLEDNHNRWSGCEPRGWLTFRRLAEKIRCLACSRRPTRGSPRAGVSSGHRRSRS